jgi:protein PhnA
VREVSTVVSGFSAALALARAGDLVATVPERHTGSLRDGLHSFALPVPLSLPEITVSLLWHPRMDGDPAHRWLRGCVRQVCADISLTIPGNPTRNPMSDLPPCPQCHSQYTYADGDLFICPDCAHEWGQDAAVAATEVRVWKDAYGNVLKDGDSVTVVKDLKIKGSSSVVKVGTKVKNIRLIEGDHDIDCKIEGFGSMQLKSEFIKKA